jgi:hypothetical protein
VDDRLWTEDDNARLRCVDWRLLLPNPTPSRSICLADGLLGDAVALISKQTDTSLDVQKACDLVVAVNPDVWTLRAARKALAPGAWCYMEWRIPVLAGPRRIRRKLETAGFDQVACYRPWPSPSQARLWLPVDGRGVVRHLRYLQGGGRTLIRQTRLLVLRWLWDVAKWAPLYPISIVARKPPSTLVAPPVRRALLERVREGWSAWGLGPTPHSLSCLLIAEGRRSISKCVALIFEEPCGHPRLAIKLPRVPAAVPALRHEAAVLKMLHARHPGAFPDIPRIVFEQWRGAGTLLGETALIGTPLRALVRRGNYRDLALKVTDWLAAFARRTARSPSMGWKRIAASALTDFTAAFGEVAENRLVQQTRGAIERVGSLPVITEQRDFSPWNVLVDRKGEVLVLDWESAELDGLPACDLIYFLTYLACELDGVHPDTASDRLRDSYRRTLDPASFTGGVRAECLARYAKKLGLEMALLPPLATLAWLIHSRSDYRQFTADAGGRPDRKALGRSVFLAFWEEEVRAGMMQTGEGAFDDHWRTPLSQPIGQPVCTPPS